MPVGKSPYLAPFREQMVELVRAGRQPGDMAKEFGCHVTSILSWIPKAQPTTALRVGLDRIDDVLHLLIEDNGRGFSPDSIPCGEGQTWARRRHLGVLELQVIPRLKPIPVPHPTRSTTHEPSRPIAATQFNYPKNTVYCV